MAQYVGIDLGTTYSAIATIDESGRAVIINNPDKRLSPKGNITPSCVLVRESDVEVGEPARKSLDLRDNAFGKFKRDMDRGSEKLYQADEESYSPIDLSALVLSHMKSVGEAAVGEIAEAVVTIPANFANEAREATMAAAKKAGLNVKYIINEPTAAALSYAMENEVELSGTYAIYDLGGGTFDISIVKVSGQDVEVVAASGLAKLGGDDFDKALIEIVRKKYNQESGKDLEKEDYTAAQAEGDKIALSQKQKVIAGNGDDINGEIITISRSEFETEVSALIAQTEMMCEAALTEAQTEASDLEEVILVGGSTRMPLVKNSVKRLFGKDGVSNKNPDEAVALGAAIYAAYKSDHSELSATQKRSISKIKVGEKCSHFFGTIAMTRDSVRQQDIQINSIVINKNTSLPCSETESFFTRYENQTAIDCSVTQSSVLETDPQFVQVVWEGELDLPEGRPSGMEIKVTFSYDLNGVMKCSFKDVESNKSTDVELSVSASSDNSSDIDKFLL